MNDLENKAKPLLTPMMSGETVRLGPSDQAVLARWLYKTALVVALTNDHEASQILQSHYRLLRDQETLPPSSQIWLARLDAPDIDAGFWVQRFDWWDREGAPELRRDGYAFLISALTVVGFGLVFDASSIGGEDLEVMRPGPLLLPPRSNRIWPPSRHYTVLWPPGATLTAKNLAQIMDAVRNAGGDSNPPGSITPGQPQEM